jgi:hypothetical protein
MRVVDNTACGFGKAESLTACAEETLAHRWFGGLASSFGFAGTVEHAKKGVKAVGSRKITRRKTQLAAARKGRGEARATHQIAMTGVVR